MIAETIFVGTELLLGEILNTNAQYMGQRLAELGVDQYYQLTVGDNPDRLAGVLRLALSRADVVITSGGLGPTQDDLTREVAAEVAGRPLELDEAYLEELRAWFRRRTGREMPENNVRQAMVPRGGRMMPNPVGTAPGLVVPVGDKVILLLPGPPHEFKKMLHDHVIPLLTERMGGERLKLFSRTLRLCGTGESAVEQEILDLIQAQSDPSLAPYAKLGEVQLRMATKASTPAEAETRFAPLESEIRRRLGRHIFGTDDTTLEQAVGARLRERGWTLALAESCTGGLVSKRITDVPGSSDYLLAGYVTYSNAAKQDLLGVRAETLQTHGAVAEATVLEMAAGAAQRAGATVALSVSGVAGPGGGTHDKPVGTVWVGLCGPGIARARLLQLRGGRGEIREWSAQQALAFLWAFLEETP